MSVCHENVEFWTKPRLEVKGVLKCTRFKVYPLEMYHPKNPPRPSRSKAGLGLMMMMMISLMRKLCL